MKVSVAQYGARRRYLIPKILEGKDILSNLYTDSHSSSFLGKIAQVLIRFGYKSKTITRLANRNPQITSSKIVSNDWLQFKIFIKSMFSATNQEIMDLIFEGSSKYFIKRYRPGDDWLYTMFIENIEFTKYVKSKGVKVLVDIYENPYIFPELAEELHHPEFDCIRHLANDHLVQANLREKYLDELLKIADKLLVPSNYVKNCLKSNNNYDEQKIHVIPYASSVNNISYSNKPVRGRIIWIGNDPVRKGLLYANRAIRNLQVKHPDIEFRVIGPLPTELQSAPFFNNIKFLGYLTKEELKHEFNAADIFVFPTLAEGFAGVILEAASFGVPIITTEASGVDDSFPGIIVPSKESKCIEDAIEQLYEDRGERDRISHQLFQYSQINNPDNFATKLIELFE